ncbi:UNVERIFIED_CONTAM: hypothetical protein Scaly_0680700 [Sesamum calycinum]|uniref:DUF4218 domain-containing protein n=1 Tax=Sesamum calycinum TaxID=2727403 RepID=A0AAW2R6T0_9LAMI
MHIEKNMFDNIFNTVMDIKGKTKGNVNARRDLKIICNRPELELDERRSNVMPKAVYTLGKEQNRRKLIPIAFCKMLFGHLWGALTEVSLLFQSICSTTLDVHKLHDLENSAAIIMCNLDKIFPWMYTFERFLSELKKKVKNKAHVEASIVKAYIIEEIGLFTSQYFESDVQSKRSMPRRTDECTSSNDGIQVSIFNYHGRASGATKKRWLSGSIRHIIKTYIVTNCEVVTPYYELDGYLKTKAWRVVDDSKWTQTATYLSKEVLPVPVVATNNQSYDLREPNDLQVVFEDAGTSWRQLHENDDENKDEDEGIDGDDETDDDEYEAT